MARDNTIKVKLDGNELARLDELRPTGSPMPLAARSAGQPWRPSGAPGSTARTPAAYGLPRSR